MPSNLGEWMFWIFSTLIVGLIVGIGVNLITPKVKDTGESWFQKRRLKKERYNKKIELIVKDLTDNPAKVWLYLGGVLMRSILYILMGFFLMIGIIVVLVINSLDVSQLSESEIWIVQLLSRRIVDHGFAFLLIVFMFYLSLVIVGVGFTKFTSFYKLWIDIRVVNARSKKVGSFPEVENAQQEMLDSTQSSHAQEEQSKTNEAPEENA